MKTLFQFALLLCLLACEQAVPETVETAKVEPEVEILKGISLVVLGTVQDAGSPQIACKKDCCRALFENPDPTRKVVSLGVLDLDRHKKYLFEATPDMVSQMKILTKYDRLNTSETADGIFLTHAHIGHYTGLMYLGKEAMSADNMPVYAMPKMKTFLEENGPWSQLVRNGNISIQALTDQEELSLSADLKVIPFRVPHRDEYSETVGYSIIGPNRSALFIPDIDKWEKWDVDIIEAISKVDIAFLDATFYDGEELNNRDISQIPHPFIIESMEKFVGLSKEEKAKIYFIHFNHTNPMLRADSKQVKKVEESGYNIAKIYDTFEL